MKMPERMLIIGLNSLGILVFDSKVVKLPKNKDPNDLGFEQMTSLIDKTISSSFSDMIQARLYG